LTSVPIDHDDIGHVDIDHVAIVHLAYRRGGCGRGAEGAPCTPRARMCVFVHMWSISLWSISSWSIATVVNRDCGQSQRGQYQCGQYQRGQYHHGQSELWSIRTLVIRDDGQSGPWSISTVVNRNVVNINVININVVNIIMVILTWSNGRHFLGSHPRPFARRSEDRRTPLPPHARTHVLKRTSSPDTRRAISASPQEAKGQNLISPSGSTRTPARRESRNSPISSVQPGSNSQGRHIPTDIRSQ